jgi:hypothetical protein
VKIRYLTTLKLIALFKFIRGFGFVMLALSLYCSIRGWLYICQFRFNKESGNALESLVGSLQSWFDGLNQISALSLASVALFFALIRFLEAIGIYFDKTWAEMMAVLTSLAALFILTWKSINDFDLVTMITLIINIGIVFFLLMVLSKKRRHSSLQTKS